VGPVPPEWRLVAEVTYPANEATQDLLGRHVSIERVTRGARELSQRGDFLRREGQTAHNEFCPWHTAFVPQWRRLGKGNREG
jgi:hypothetical protein